MSTTPDMQAQISLLDNAYQKLAKVTFRGRGVMTGREQAWYAFLEAGYTLKDLDTVLCWLNRRIREGKRDPCAVRFSSLVGNLDRFQEELSFAEALSRKPKASARDTVLAQARPVIGGGTPALVPDTSKPLGNVIPKLLEAMREAAK